MIVLEIIDRLIQGASPPFSLVEGASELAAVARPGGGQPAATPAAYVYISEEASADNERATGVLQRTELDISVLIVAGNLSDRTGGAAASDVEAMKTAALTALVGWKPPSADDVLTHVGGRTVQFRDGTVWWEMTLATAKYLEAA